MQNRNSFELPVWQTTEHLAKVITNLNQLAFQLPSNAVLDEPSIIAFVADPSANTERIDYEIAINGRVFPMGNVGTGVKRGLWKLVPGGVLRAGNANNITFTTTHVEIPEHGGKPTIEFSDIVLWFQRAVAEAT
jgi:hypothetical protein